MDYDSILGKGNKPTEQQAECVEAFMSGEDICIEARVGASKTTTSRLMAESCKGKSILYLAFNRHVITEAQGKMPKDNVEVRTFHSLAYRAVGHNYQDKLSRPQGKYRNVGGTISEAREAISKKYEKDHPYFATMDFF